MISKEEFRKYAIHNQGVSGTAFDQYTTHIENMTRSVIEERPQNFREIDVFSRLIMDRIIFLGTGVDDHIANIIVAQLLFLEYINGFFVVVNSSWWEVVKVSQILYPSAG